MYNRWWLMTLVSLKRSWSGRLHRRVSKNGCRRLCGRRDIISVLGWNRHNRLKRNSIRRGWHINLKWVKRYIG